MANVVISKDFKYFAVEGKSSESDDLQRNTC